MGKNVVFITGSSSGIGREIAHKFAAAGARLALTYYTGKKGGEETEKQCRALGTPDTLLLRLDVTDDRSIASAVGQIREKFGGIDVLVNNAGMGVFSPFGKTSPGDIERQLRTNLEGLIKVTLAALPLVKKTIINIASYLGKYPMTGGAVYCASKYGVRGFTQSLALELPGINVFCVNPDMIATRLTDYQGRPPGEVADVVFGLATGKIKRKSGEDADVWRIKRNLY